MANPNASSAELSSYEAELDRWHQGRLARLTAEDGYLSLTGLHWVTAEGSTIPTIGEARVEDSGVRLDLEPGFTCQGQAVSEIVLDLDLPEAQQVLERGSQRVFAIKRGPWIGLRVRDSQAPTRIGFDGVARFPVDPEWRIPGRLVSQPETLEVASVVGVSTSERSPGWAVFEWQGKEHKARLIGDSDDESFFLVFSDQTAGESTYPACRFLSVERTGDNGLVLDFNKSINPACAFTQFATCPLPPQENLFPFPIPAGERKPQ